MEEEKKKYVVSCLYIGGMGLEPCALGVYDTREEAEAALNRDMLEFAEREMKTCHIAHGGVWSSPDEVFEDGCKWNISEVTA